MPPKSTAKATEKAVTGKEAEELVLHYLKSVNRPYAATDVSANLKNKVTKINAQKVLQILADRGDLTLKMYGKQSIFVYNQANLPCVPAEAMVDIDNDLKTVADDLEAMKKKFRTLTMQTAALTSQPKTEDLGAEIQHVQRENELLLSRLEPLRAVAQAEGSGQDLGSVGPASKDELEQVDKEWQRWRKEWVTRRKTYMAFLDSLKPEDSAAQRSEFEEAVGVERETDEIVEVESSDLCKPAPRLANKLGGATASIVIGAGQKRKRS